MTQENTKLCDFSNTNNNDFIGTPLAPENEVLNFKQREGENLKDACWNLKCSE